MRKTHRASITRLLTPAEIEEKTGGITASKLARWRKMGTGPRYVRAGHSTVLYDEEAFLAWLSENEVFTDGGAA